MQKIKQVPCPIPVANRTGYLGTEHPAVFLEAESASADTHIVHPRCRTTGYYTLIKVETTIDADIKKVWKHWNDAESIQGWAFASDDWECPYAENDLRVGGRFLTRMSAKDNSASFDFTGTYTDVVELSTINYLMDKADGEGEHRECNIVFTDLGDGATKVEEEFYPEEINSAEMQKAGWSAILENFKKFVASK